MARRGDHAVTRPLRRAPKTLTEEPMVFQSSGASGGFALQAVGRGVRGHAVPAPAGAVTGFTDDPAERVAAEQAAEQAALEPAVRERARRIAAALSVPRARTPTRLRRGRGELASLPYRGVADELDLDATLEVLIADPAPADEDLVVRERVLATRSVVLAVDVSGSSRGERILTAAALVGALAGELHRDRLAVVAFWSDAAVLAGLDEPVDPQRVLEQVLRIPARGLTNLEFPLRLAAEQLAAAPPGEARVLLFSDCVHNAGPDPRPAAAALPRLDVLVDVGGEHDLELGRELAERGHGTAHAIRDYREVAPAIGAVFRDGARAS